MTDWARCERLARQASRRWRRHPDHDDILQECRIVAWRLQRLPDSHVVRSCQWRIVDCLRSWRSDRRRPTPTLVPLHDHDAATVDDTDLVLELGLTGRHACIAAGLAAGRTRRAIAADLGVDPSRVSQLIAELRQLIA